MDENNLWEKQVILQAMLDEAHEKFRKQMGRYPDQDHPLTSILERSGYRVTMFVEKMPKQS